MSEKKLSVYEVAIVTNGKVSISAILAKDADAAKTKVIIAHSAAISTDSEVSVRPFCV